MTITEVGHTSAPSSPTADTSDGVLWAKKVSLTAGDLLIAIRGYGRYGTPGNGCAIGCAVYTDDSAVPGIVVASSLSSPNMVLTTHVGTVGADRWFQMPIEFPVESSGDYWLCVGNGQLFSSNGDWDLYYEGSGGDYRWSTSSYLTSDYANSNNTSKTNTGNDYLIRGVVLS